MDLVRIYLQESAKFALLAQQAKVDAGAKDVRETTEAADRARMHKDILSNTATELIKQGEELKVTLDVTEIRLREIEEKYEVNLKHAKDSKSNAALLAAYKVELESSILKQESIQMRIALYEKSIEIETANARIPEAEEEFTAAMKALENTTISLTDLKKTFELSKDSFEDDWPEAGNITYDTLDIERLTNELGEAKSTIKKLELEIKDSEATIQKLKQQVKSQTDLAEEEQFSQRLKDAVDLNAKLISDNQNEINCKERLAKELEEAVTTIYYHESENASISRTRNRLSSELNYANQKLNAQAMDLDYANREKEKFEKQLAFAFKTQESNIVEIEQLTVDKEYLVKQLGEAESIIKEQKLTIDQRTKEIVRQTKKTTTSTPTAIAEDQDMQFNALEEAKIALMKHESDTDDAKKKAEQLAAELEDAKSTMLKQVIEIVGLKAGKTTIENSPAVGQGLAQPSSVTPSKYTASTCRTIEALKTKIEQMMPLYEVGNLVRARKHELCVPRASSNKEIMKLGLLVAFNGQALADSTMFLDFAIKRYGSEILFEKRYGVNPVFVWENRKFTMFLNIIDWKLVMDSDDQRFGMGGILRKEFNDLYGKIFPSLYPSSDIASDEQLRQNKDLLDIYEGLKLTYRNAVYQSDQKRIARRPS